MRYRFLETAALLLIVALAAYLRLTNLADNPGWYTDEATHINIAHHLAEGRVQYFAINQSVLLFARPPVFHLVLSALFRLFGEGFGTLRVFTACLGVLSVALLYGFTRRATGDGALALLAAFMLALYPQAVLYSRFGFSYNLLAPLLIAVAFGLWDYLQTGRRRGLALAALLTGLGTISDLAFYTVIPTLLIVALIRRPRDLLWSLPLAALPFSLYAVWMLASVGEVFWFDLRFTLTRLSSLSLPDQIGNIALNYTTLISQDFWLLAGVIGLWLVNPARLKALVLLLFWFPLVIMGRSVALYSLSFYYMLPLLPLVALGVAALVRCGTPYLWTNAWGGLLQAARATTSAYLMLVAIGATGLALLLMVVSPFLTTFTLLNAQVRSHYQTAIDPFLLSPDDARRAADYVNTHSRPADLVIASPPMGWQFRAQTADFQMAVAYTGDDTPHLPGTLPHSRFAFDPTYTHAHFVVVDNLWRNWGAVHIPGALAMLRAVETGWPRVFESGAVQVYRNPDVRP
jgi:4-amino-4-deoxy-L-arabinose transferase-like glycosyltransferase